MLALKPEEALCLWPRSRIPIQSQLNMVARRLGGWIDRWEDWPQMTDLNGLSLSLLIYKMGLILE